MSGVQRMTVAGLDNMLPLVCARAALQPVIWLAACPITLDDASVKTFQTMTLSKVISGSIFTFDQLAGALDAGAEAEVFKRFRDLRAGLLCRAYLPRFSTLRMVDQIAVS